jgi:hypothetical protein
MKIHVRTKKRCEEISKMLGGTSLQINANYHKMLLDRQFYEECIQKMKGGEKN